MHIIMYIIKHTDFFFILEMEECHVIGLPGLSYLVYLVDLVNLEGRTTDG